MFMFLDTIYAAGVVHRAGQLGGTLVELQSAVVKSMLGQGHGVEGTSAPALLPPALPPCHHLAREGKRTSGGIAVSHRTDVVLQEKKLAALCG
uniref:Uncharacterized protein n=1 Tax=Arundo donax TaxID=35708 RepID=A0A0A9DFN8_ARUDO